MTFSWLAILNRLQAMISPSSVSCFNRHWQRFTAQLLLIIIVGLSCAMLLGMSPVLAGRDDDRFDGNIFPLYAGDGSLVPPKVTLKQALNSSTPTLLVFYIDDSLDCKQYAPVISRLSSPYGRVADFIPISIDRLPAKETYDPTEPGYYYEGFVPQTVLFDQSGQVVLNAKGLIPYEQVDDAFREVFDLLPRSESVDLKRRSSNEVSTEIAK
jgi:hypothetical protein